ncbi:pilus assembly protein CpaB [Solimonas aquatica]|uniref:Pilus assembly protein CpaB n=1 Tax=Solimonas aquatica TaxID=489703 RepID=A0A1H9HXJ1_9GAMM|nr:Flp pilus assembly protein CpaB [Solimonas aquatica]SEQ67050.1 pilus assembly protein CpaB [Solimonas aquatica]
MLRKPLFSLGLAVVLGLIAALFAAHWIQGRAKAVEADLRDSVQVVVAATAINPGAQLRAQDLKLAPWPRNSLPQDSLGKLEDAAGKYAAQKILPGEPVFRQRLLDKPGNALSAQIEPSKRAISVRVNDVIGVAGFLMPGCRVDVLATRVDNERRASTRTLLQDIKVLAVDQTAQVEKDEPVVVRAVTLEVTPQDAEQLMGATEEGTVQLSLRNPDDQKSTPAAAAPSAAPAQAAVAPASGQGPHRAAGDAITVIRLAQTVKTRVRP